MSSSFESSSADASHLSHAWQREGWRGNIAQWALELEKQYRSMSLGTREGGKGSGRQQLGRNIWKLQFLRVGVPCSDSNTRNRDNKMLWIRVTYNREKQGNTVPLPGPLPPPPLHPRFIILIGFGDAGRLLMWCSIVKWDTWITIGHHHYH